MQASYWDWLLWGSVLLGGVAFARHVANDDGHLKAHREQALQRRLARYPASARAVIIRAQPVPWTRTVLALGSIIVIAAGIPYFLRGGIPLLCNRIGPASTLEWLRFALFPGVPALLMWPVAIGLRQAVRILRGGYAPPLDSRLARDTVAVSGWRARLQGVTNLAIAIAVICVIGYWMYDLRRPLDANDAGARFVASCVVGTHSPQEGPAHR